MDRKLIVFDFVYTLAFLKPSDCDIIYHFLKKKISKAKIEKTLSIMSKSHFYSSLKIKDKKARRIFYITYHDKLLNLLGVKRFKNDSIDLNYYFSLQKRSWFIKKKMKKKLIQLNNYFDLAIASNFDNNLNNYLIQNGVFSLFKFILVSKKIGVEKPFNKFYQILKKKISNQDSIFIGDNYYLDYLPAKKNNLKSYLIVDKTQKKYHYEIVRNKIENGSIKDYQALFKKK